MAYTKKDIRQVLQTTNKRNCSRDYLDMANKRKHQKRDFFIAAQDNAIVDVVTETKELITCSKMSQKEYKIRHDRVEKHDLLGIVQKIKT